ncbi:unnamed protein product, partial [Rotaria magnacalcarata]
MKLSESNFFSTNRSAELQRHNRSDSELKQQHEVLLSTLLLEQQLHSTSTDEHKRPPRSAPSTVDFYFSDITANTTPIVDDDSEALLKLCDEIRPNLILTTGGTRISLYDITPEVCVLVLLLFNRLISALGDELSYYKENLWPNTDNGCEVISNCSYGYAVE